MTVLYRLFQSKHSSSKIVTLNFNNLIYHDTVNINNYWKFHIKKLCHTSISSPWRVLFFGSDNFSLESLRTLNKEYNAKILIQRLEVVTLYSTKNDAIINYIKEHGLKLHTWPYNPDKDEFDIGIVTSFGRLIPEKVINSFPLGIINVHASLLPRWRGAAPITYSLKNGDTKTGITLMRIKPKKFDVGDIIFQQEVDIGENELYPEVHNKLAKCGGQALIKVLTELPNILFQAKPQNKEDVTYAPKITSDISYVKWDKMTGKNVFDLYRALYGIHHLRTKFNNKIIKLLDINYVKDNWNVNCFEKKVPGLVLYDKEKKLLLVSCSEYDWITVGRIIIPGKTAMSAKDFYSGFFQSRNVNHCYFTT